MIQVYIGDGKGKTTVAFGLAMRASGHGYKVRVIQFMKGNTYTGELYAAEKLGIEVLQFGRTCPHAAVIKSGFMVCQECGQCWINAQTITDLDRQKNNLGWQLAKDTIINNEHDLLILDEILSAVEEGLVVQNGLIQWLKQVPENIEIVLTGRSASLEVIAIADLVSEIKQVKHPYNRGFKSRRGIEY